MCVETCLRCPTCWLQYDVTLRAWHRLHKAHSAWFCSLNDDERQKFRATDSEIEELRPMRFERDDSIKSELLATVASARLGTTKTKVCFAMRRGGTRILMGIARLLERIAYAEK